MKKILTFLVFAVFLMACGSGVDTKALRDEVLDIHDEVMPKMGEVMSLRKKVLTQSQELALETDANSDKISKLESLAADLENANKGMMSWMNDWAKTSTNYLNDKAQPKDGVETSDVVKFLEDEKERVSEVRDAINKSIKDAKEALGS